MGQLSPILRHGRSPDGQLFLSFWCLGCDEVHSVKIAEDGKPGWSWNASAERPTFGPSILVTSGHYTPGFPHGAEPDCACNYNERYPDEDPWPWPCSRCHSFVEDGNIRYLGDCTHRLAGQIVALPAWSEGIESDGA
jgi:hypothetical protein